MSDRQNSIVEQTIQHEREKNAIANDLHDEFGACFMQLRWLFITLEKEASAMTGLSPDARETLLKIAENGHAIIKPAVAENKVVNANGAGSL